MYEDAAESCIRKTVGTSKTSLSRSLIVWPQWSERCAQVCAACATNMPTCKNARRGMPTFGGIRRGESTRYGCLFKVGFPYITPNFRKKGRRNQTAKTKSAKTKMRKSKKRNTGITILNIQCAQKNIRPLPGIYIYGRSVGGPNSSTPDSAFVPLPAHEFGGRSRVSFPTILRRGDSARYHRPESQARGRLVPVRRTGPRRIDDGRMRIRLERYPIRHARDGLARGYYPCGSAPLASRTFRNISRWPPASTGSG